jgi:hypothetical protein
VSDSSTVDVAELGRRFEADIEQWRTRPVTGDSSSATVQPVTSDSAPTSPPVGTTDTSGGTGRGVSDSASAGGSVEMVRDSGQ